MITNRDKTWFNLALKISADSDCSNKHGCVIVRSGTVLSVATNRIVISHPVSNRYLKQTLHAEQRAILRAADCKGATLYSARLHRNKLSAPCDMCSALIKEAGVYRIVYHDGQELVKIAV